MLIIQQININKQEQTNTIPTKKTQTQASTRNLNKQTQRSNNDSFNTKQNKTKQTKTYEKQRGEQTPRNTHAHVNKTSTTNMVIIKLI